MTHSCKTQIILYTHIYTHHKDASSTHGSAFGKQVSLAQLSHRNTSIFVRSAFGKPLLRNTPPQLSHHKRTKETSGSLAQLTHHKTTKETYIPSKKAKDPDKRDLYSDCAQLSRRNMSRTISCASLSSQKDKIQLYSYCAQLSLCSSQSRPLSSATLSSPKAKRD